MTKLPLHMRLLFVLCALCIVTQAALAGVHLFRGDDCVAFSHVPGMWGGGTACTRWESRR